MRRSPFLRNCYTTTPTCSSSSPGVRNPVCLVSFTSGGCVLANNNSRIPQQEFNDLTDAISAQFFLICSKWKEHFAIEEINFYC